MTDLETLVRDSLADEAGRAPATSGEGLLDAVTRRNRADRPVARAVLWVAVAAVLVALAAGLATALSGGVPRPSPAGGGGAIPSSGPDLPPVGATARVPDGALVTRGDCAGLVVRLIEPDDSGLARTVRPLVPGANTWTTEGRRTLYLQGTGPCVDRLIYDVTNQDGVHRVQGSDGDLAQRLRDGLGALVVDEAKPGEARVDLTLACPSTASCPGTREVLASLVLTLAPTGRGSTTQPSGLPVRTTVTVSENGSVSSRVVTGQVPDGPTTVTLTVRATP